MRISNISDKELSSEEYEALCEARKHGELVREFIQAEVRRQIAEQIFTLKDQIDRYDIRIFHLMVQVDSMEESIKDTNKKVTMIRNQIRKEKGREEL